MTVPLHLASVSEPNLNMTVREIQELLADLLRRARLNEETNLAVRLADQVRHFEEFMRLDRVTIDSIANHVEEHSTALFDAWTELRRPVLSIFAFGSIYHQTYVNQHEQASHEQQMQHGKEAADFVFSVRPNLACGEINTLSSSLVTRYPCMGTWDRCGGHCEICRIMQNRIHYLRSRGNNLDFLPGERIRKRSRSQRSKQSRQLEGGF